MWAIPFSLSPQDIARGHVPSQQKTGETKSELHLARMRMHGCDYILCCMGNPTTKRRPFVSVLFVEGSPTQSYGVAIKPP